MSTFRLKRKNFGGGFNKGTYDAMMNAANNATTLNAKRQFDAYSKKYANDIAELNKSRQLAAPVPKTNPITNPVTPNSTPKLGNVGGLKGAWNRMGKMGKAGTIAAGATGAYILGKGLFGGNK